MRTTRSTYVTLRVCESSHNRTDSEAAGKGGYKVEHLKGLRAGQEGLITVA